jgi:hypothetical protein
LDLHAVVWLEEYLRGYENTVIVVSHARDFLNSVVTDILQLDNKKITRLKTPIDSQIFFFFLLLVHFVPVDFVLYQKAAAALFLAAN